MRSKLYLSAIALGLVLISTPLHAADYVRVIEVDGNGDARAVPDQATVAVAVETHAPTAERASAENAALAQKVIDALKAKLDGQGVISTSDYSLNPDYSEPRGNENPKIIGYGAQNTVNVETSDLSLVGALIDSAVGAGANRINSISFGLRNDADARAAAIREASRDAQAQAAALATSLGVKLKQVIKASTVQEERPVFPMARGLAMAAVRAPTPIERGEVHVSATVSLTYEIE